MKNDHPEITTLSYKTDDGDIIEYPIACTETKRLIGVLINIDAWDYDFVAPVISELCERYGLDFDGYECCDDCYDDIMNLYIAEDVNSTMSELEKMERTIEHRVIRDINGFYRSQTRFLPLESWESGDGWRTTYISTIPPKDGVVALDEWKENKR